VRFSDTNSFYGDHHSPLPYQQLILDNVQEHQIAGGRPAEFMATLGDNRLYWVEVTAADFAAVQPRDIAEFPEDEEDSVPANSYQLDDNCYYVTAAHLLGTDVNALINRTGVMQDRGGVSLDAIQSLFQAVGLTSTYRQANSVDELEELVESAAGGLDREFALAFVRGNGTRHVVVAVFARDDQIVSYRDYQLDNSGADAAGDIATGSTFYLFA
jgi:hypothetical protein